MTDKKINRYYSLFKEKLIQGVEISIKTRPPNNQGSIKDYAVHNATNLLNDLGINVTYRRNMHEKVVLIDNKILWSGSLNILSFSGNSQELMTRIRNSKACELMEKSLKKTEEAENILRQKRNKYKTRTYVDVAYEEKESAKAEGARWDGKIKMWYFPIASDAYNKRWKIVEEI